MYFPWLTILPPLVVIVATILTRNVLISLAGGVLSAAAIAADFNPIATLSLAAQRIVEETDIPHFFSGGSTDHLYTFSFLLLLGVLIQLMNHSGGIRAYTQFLLRYIPTARAAQQTSLLLSSTLFIDDYVNNLTVGAIMRPVTDHFKIARAKLAFLLDSMSGPLCLLIPASSWVAFILAQMQASGITGGGTGALIQADPLLIYCACIPYLLYPLLIVFVAWITVYGNFSYGTMGEFEKIAQQRGNLYGGKAALTPGTHISEQFQGTLLDFIIPITSFIGTFILTILYCGNSKLMGGTANMIETFQRADPFWSLLTASMIAVGITSTLFLYHNPGKARYLGHAFFDGFICMKNSLVILLLAWTLSTLLKNDLQTGTYIASLLPAKLPVSYLPGSIFIVCTLISASTGSVWGTIALMLPIMVPLYYDLAAGSPTLLNNLYPVLSALFSGAVAGSHFSPISDAMIMTSFSAGCYHLDHVRTQVSYALNALLGAAAGFFVLALLPGTWSYTATVSTSLCVSFSSALILIVIRQRWAKRYGY